MIIFLLIKLFDQLFLKYQYYTFDQISNILILNNRSLK